jgi:HPt (histidine-containing phosphotransfer) domain-containing protein
VRENAEDFCRQLEAYLCRKNDGHLIRIVGPAFEQVCGWAERGIPLTLAMRGIDRYFERYYAKGPRRRPVRIEFCEADVLDVFDEWRRAVGVSVTGEAGEAGEAGRGSLPAHLERIIARLTTLRGGSERSMDSILDDIVRELDAARAKAKSIRGAARAALIDRLRQLDASLVDALRQHAGDQTLQQLAAEADEELKPFRARMPAEAYQQSRRACIDRLLRDRAGLPTIAYE